MSARRSKRSADDAAEMESPPTSPTPDLSAEAPFLPFAERARQATPMRDKCESTAICIGQPSHPNSSATVGCPCRRPPSGALGGGGAPTRGAQSAEPHRQEGRGEGAGSRGCVPTTAPQPRGGATPRSKPETPRLLPSTQGGSPEAVRRSTPLPPAPEQSEPAPEDATRGGPWEEVQTTLPLRFARRVHTHRCMSSGARPCVGRIVLLEHHDGRDDSGGRAQANRPNGSSS